LPLHGAGVLVAELGGVVLEAREVLAREPARLAAVRVPQDAVRRVVRQRELLVEPRVADADVEVRLVRRDEPEVGAAAHTVVVVVVEGPVLVALLAGDVEVVRLAAAPDREVHRAGHARAERVRLTRRLLREEAGVVLGPALLVVLVL